MFFFILFTICLGRDNPIACNTMTWVTEKIKLAIQRLTDLCLLFLLSIFYNKGSRWNSIHVTVFSAYSVYFVTNRETSEQLSSNKRYEEEVGRICSLQNNGPCGCCGNICMMCCRVTGVCVQTKLVENKLVQLAQRGRWAGLSHSES